MGKIYKNQTAVKITTTVDEDVSGATVVLKYEKPDKITGEFSANIVVINPTKGVFEWTPTDANDLDVIGVWKLWAYVTFADLSKVAGQPFTIEIHKEGT